VEFLDHKKSQFGWKNEDFNEVKQLVEEVSEQVHPEILAHLPGLSPVSEQDEGNDDVAMVEAFEKSENEKAFVVVAATNVEVTPVVVVVVVDNDDDIFQHRSTEMTKYIL